MTPKSGRRKVRRKRVGRAGRTVIDMSAGAARTFLLKPESYSRLELPPYLTFAPVLKKTDRRLSMKPLAERKLRPQEAEGVNYTIYSNKDGQYAWRPVQLINPVLYVDLVKCITEPAAWRGIQARFREFAREPKVLCLSLPQESSTKRRDQGAQILRWWQEVEQASIDLALDFSYVLHADIAECYASIYTHSIAWALHGKEVAKKKRGVKSLVGNGIDSRVRSMQHGQTNGIPQGSVLMDLVGEMVLGYADMQLAGLLVAEPVVDYKVLRYRDDYRIFTNDSQASERILKRLTEVLIDLGLKLNATKTTDAKTVVGSSVKRDKLVWLRGKQRDRNLQKHLLLIHSHGLDYPNGGSLVGPLQEFYRRIEGLKTVKNATQLMSIAIDIGCISPRCFPACAAISSKLLSLLKKDERPRALERVRQRLRRLPNSGHLEVWLQRISLAVDPKVSYGEKLCKLVAGEDVEIWSTSWIGDGDLKKAADPKGAVNQAMLKKLRPVMRRREFDVFAEY